MSTRRRLPLLRWLLLLVAAFLASTTAVLLLWRIDRVVVAPGKLAGGTVPCSSPRDGVVAEATARPGKAVRAGDALFRLDTTDLAAEAAASDARLAGLRGERDSKAAERRRLAESVHPREREEAIGTLERARVAEERAGIETAASKRLGEQGIVGRIEVRKAELDLELAVKDRQRAEGAIALLEAQQRSGLETIDADLARLDAEIEAETVARDAARARIAASAVRSPADGTVEGEGLEELAGRAVREGDEVLRIRRDAPARFDGMLGDAARATVRAGQRASIRLDGFPWLIHGTLQGAIERVADRRGDGAGFAVEVRLDAGAKGPGPLREGMKGTARIAVGERVSLGRLLLERIAGREGP